MIILDKGAVNGQMVAERMFPLVLDSNNILRVATASTYLNQNDSISWYRFYSNDYLDKTVMGNSVGRFYFQPSCTGPVYNSAAGLNVVEALASVHYSPHKDYLPTLATDSSGNYFSSYGEYDSSQSLFCPFLYRGNSSKLPLKDIERLGYVASITHESGGNYTNVWTRVYTNNTPNFRLWRWHAWCLGILTTSGTTDITKFVMNHNYGSVNHNVKVDIMLNSGNSVYLLIKADINEMSQSDLIQWTNSYSISYFDQPRLKIELANNSSWQVTSYGFDITGHPPYRYEQSGG